MGKLLVLLIGTITAIAVTESRVAEVTKWIVVAVFCAFGLFVVFSKDVP